MLARSLRSALAEYDDCLVPGVIRRDAEKELIEKVEALAGQYAIPRRMLAFLPPRLGEFCQ